VVLQSIPKIGLRLSFFCNYTILYFPKVNVAKAEKLCQLLENNHAKNVIQLQIDHTVCNLNRYISLYTIP